MESNPATTRMEDASCLPVANLAQPWTIHRDRTIAFLSNVHKPRAKCSRHLGYHRVSPPRSQRDRTGMGFPHPIKYQRDRRYLLRSFVNPSQPWVRNHARPGPRIPLDRHEPYHPLPLHGRPVPHQIMQHCPRYWTRPSLTTRHKMAHLRAGQHRRDPRIILEDVPGINRSLACLLRCQADNVPQDPFPRVAHYTHPPVRPFQDSRYHRQHTSSPSGITSKPTTRAASNGRDLAMNKKSRVLAQCSVWPSLNQHLAARQSDVVNRRSAYNAGRHPHLP